MKIHPQTIYNGKQAEFVVLPVSEYKKMLSLIETIQDIHEIENSIQSNSESFPIEVVRSLADGVNPIKIYREYRGISQTTLAKKVNVSKQYISQLETKVRVGTPQLLKSIAKVLKIDLEDLIT